MGILQFYFLAALPGWEILEMVGPFCLASFWESVPSLPDFGWNWKSSVYLFAALQSKVDYFSVDLPNLDRVPTD